MSGHSLGFYSRFQGVFRRPPITDQSLRLVATGALSSSSQAALRRPPSQRQRRGSGVNQLYCPRRIRGTCHRDASPVMGSGDG